jgi:hypothetical protein
MLSGMEIRSTLSRISRGRKVSLPLCIRIGSTFKTLGPDEYAISPVDAHIAEGTRTRTGTRTGLGPDSDAGLSYVQHIKHLLYN